MQPPTDAEIQRAYDEITADGPMAPQTMALGLAVLKSAVLQRFLDRVAPIADLDRSVVMGALVAGLNYGLRIGEARAKEPSK